MTASKAHLDVLDGWRGLSILFVLAAHWLPLGPKDWRLNEMSGPMGMALFFVLSGFLITRFLLADQSIPRFLVRRACRIVPLAWLTLAIALPLTGTAKGDYFSNFFFYANLPPFHLTETASHFWSLGVEMQFYLGVALIVGLLGRRGLYLVLPLCIAVTVHRAMTDAYVDVVTWRRVDEILAGATLALIHAGKMGSWSRIAIQRSSMIRIVALMVLFTISSHPGSGFMNYFRPYLAAALVGSTLLDPPTLAVRLLTQRWLVYLAAISFALYVIHGVLGSSWLASGDKMAKYLKRPLLIGATFALAHFSTFHYERLWIDFGKRMTGAARGAREK